DFCELAALGFVGLRADGSGDLESFGRQQIRRASRSIGMVGDQYDHAILGDFGEMLLEIAGLNAEVYGETAVGSNFVRPSNVNQQDSVRRCGQPVKFGSIEDLCLGGRSSALLRKTHGCGQKNESKRLFHFLVILRRFATRSIQRVGKGSDRVSGLSRSRGRTYPPFRKGGARVKATSA